MVSLLSRALSVACAIKATVVKVLCIHPSFVRTLALQMRVVLGACLRRERVDAVGSQLGKHILRVQLRRLQQHVDRVRTLFPISFVVIVLTGSRCVCFLLLPVSCHRSPLDCVCMCPAE